MQGFLATPHFSSTCLAVSRRPLGVVRVFFEAFYMPTIPAAERCQALVATKRRGGSMRRTTGPRSNPLATRPPLSPTACSPHSRPPSRPDGPTASMEAATVIQSSITFAVRPSGSAIEQRTRSYRRRARQWAPRGDVINPALFCPSGYPRARGVHPSDMIALRILPSQSRYCICRLKMPPGYKTARAS